MNHHLRQAAGAASAIGFLSLSAVAALAQPGRPPQPSQPPAPGQPVPEIPSEQPPNQVGRWRNFRFPEGRFSIALPQEPVRSSDKDSDGDISYTYKVERGDDFYVISHMDIASLREVSASGVREILQKMPAELIKAIDGQLLSNKSISLRRNPGQEFDFMVPLNGKQTSGKGRIYVMGTRVYTLVSVGNPRDLRRFINSFDLI